MENFLMEVKKPTTYSEQIEKIEARGCIIYDKERCCEILSSVGYYRFSAYFLPSKKQDGRYEDGTTFEHVYRLYEFDRKLRNILFAIIEDIEIYMRSKLSYFHAHKYGALGYLNPANFGKKHDGKAFADIISDEIKHNSEVQFVKHHINQYEGQFPLWVAMELFTFGMLSKFYGDMKTSDKKELFGVKYESVSSWLRCCTDLRNICAHYGRLYYRKFTAIPKNLNLDAENERSLWGVVLTVKELNSSNEKWNAEVVLKLAALFEEYRDDIDLRHISFPDNWETILSE